jgi:orotate phosphoribosyltransferase
MILLEKGKQMLHYRSLNDLNRAIIYNSPKIPQNTDLIVGVPRSGLLAANILALHLNLPLADIDGFLCGRILTMGKTRKLSSHKFTFKDFKNVLIVDDSVMSGSQMDSVRQVVEKTVTNKEIKYCAVFVAPGQENKVDIAFEVCPKPRIFEWNFIHSWVLQNSCVDIDGVICRDPTEAENDDGEKYLKFLNSCSPLFLPTLPIGYLVTCRIEKYRRETEKWLKSHSVEYKKLIMMNLPDKSARQKSGSHSAYKAKIYSESGSQLFIESSLNQAIEIADYSGKPVLCVEIGNLIYPKISSLSKNAITKLPSYLNKRRRRALSKIGNLLTGIIDYVQ